MARNNWNIRIKELEQYNTFHITVIFINLLPEINISVYIML